MRLLKKGTTLIICQNKHYLLIHIKKALEIYSSRAFLFSFVKVHFQILIPDYAPHMLRTAEKMQIIGEYLIKKSLPVFEGRARSK